MSLLVGSVACAIVPSRVGNASGHLKVDLPDWSEPARVANMPVD